ncbi:hypothetical protein BPOR_0034g00020 [Botrytis porri]|uniref:FAD-binding domain-containing protein n=1 Tax=Botrytis porri TaxID=87229 RepID=A0A4Z1L352_9HELO|nr:hypothetical protein BPOR_0034g00020 [Botrytis porri]
MPLKIIIIGAGIGGLTAAIALREEGHEVTIFEQTQFASEYGAAIHIQPNANGILRRLGVFLEESGANSLDWMTEYTSSGLLNRTMDLVEADKQWHHPWFLAHRVQLHSHLKSKALTLSPPHLPITLLTSHKVTTLDPTTSTVYFSNGESFTGDLIIGADGVHSLTRSFVQPPECKVSPFACGKSAYRFLLSRSSVLSNPKTAKFMQKDGELIMWFGTDRRVIAYPTSSNSLLNFVCLHPDALSENTDNGEGWGKEGDRENLLKIYDGWDKDMLELLKMAPLSDSSDTSTTGTLKVWRLLDMYPLPTFTKENLVLLGDAAHPNLPHQGQGAGSAIEDAAALAVVLPGNVRKDDIQERLKLYEEIRMGRAHRIQEFSRILGRDPVEGDEVIIDIRQFVNHNLQHDEWDNSTHELRKWMWKRNPELSTYYLRPASFDTSPETYEQFWFCIEDVEYTTDDGKTLKGNFVPIVFETTSIYRSTTQVIKSDGDAEREEDLEIGTHELRIFSRETGQRIGNFTLENLAEVVEAQEDGDQKQAQNKDEEEKGFLSWRYDDDFSLASPNTSPSPQGKIHYIPSLSPPPSSSHTIKKSASTSPNSSFICKQHKDPHNNKTTPETQCFSSSPEFAPHHLEHGQKGRDIIEHMVERLGEVSCYGVVGARMEVEVREMGVQGE